MVGTTPIAFAPGRFAHPTPVFYKVVNEQEVSGLVAGRGCNSNADRCHA
jgi:hypothetical protein